MEVQNAALDAFYVLLSILDATDDHDKQSSPSSVATAAIERYATPQPHQPSDPAMGWTFPRVIDEKKRRKIRRSASLKPLSTSSTRLTHRTMGTDPTKNNEGIRLDVKRKYEIWLNGVVLS